MPRRRNTSLEVEGAGVSLGGQGKSVRCELLSATSAGCQRKAHQMKVHSCPDAHSWPPRWARAAEWEIKGEQALSLIPLCKKSTVLQYWLQKVFTSPFQEGEMPEELLAGENNLSCDGFIVQRLSRIGSKKQLSYFFCNGHIYFWESKHKISSKITCSYVIK